MKSKTMIADLKAKLILFETKGEISKRLKTAPVEAQP
jgi:hypothetical protein